MPGSSPKEKVMDTRESLRSTLMKKFLMEKIKFNVPLSGGGAIKSSEVVI